MPVSRGWKRLPRFERQGATPADSDATNPAPPAAAGGAEAPVSDIVADEVDQALQARDYRTATRRALEMSAGLVVRGLVPRANPDPLPADVERFRAFLERMEAGGRIADLRVAFEDEDRRHLAQPGGSPAKEHFGPFGTMAAAVEAFGTVAERAAWNHLA